MSTLSPAFFSGPIRYCRWAAREKPALFYSCIIGGAGPLMLITVPPIRRGLGYERSPPIPLTYPIPSGPRKSLSGYDD